MSQPGWLVEIFPLLRFVPAWMPGAGFKRRAAWVRQRMANLELFPFNWAKEQIVRYNHAMLDVLSYTDFISYLSEIRKLH